MHQITEQQIYILMCGYQGVAMQMLYDLYYVCVLHLMFKVYFPCFIAIAYTLKNK